LIGFDPYADREYRALHNAPDLGYFRVSIDETDLHIGTRIPLREEAFLLALEARQQVQAEIQDRPRFLTTLSPLRLHGTETPLIRSMLNAGILADVGPMAAVAGAIAAYVGQGLRQKSPEVIVENGGDVYLFGPKERLVAVHAGSNPLSGMLAVAVTPESGLGVCTSSGTVGHSLSLGKADAAMVISPDCALADAAATRLGNLVSGSDRLEQAVETICRIDGVLGALVIAGDRLAIQGQVDLRIVK